MNSIRKQCNPIPVHVRTKITSAKTQSIMHQFPAAVHYPTGAVWCDCRACVCLSVNVDGLCNIEDRTVDYMAMAFVLPVTMK